MNGKHKPASEVLIDIEVHARDLIDGRAAPYDAGWAMWGASMSGVGERTTDGAHCNALWLLWGALTDWVEVKPAETEQAEAAMRRAATEWLAVHNDETQWRPFFDHWLYLELGYERPPEGEENGATR